MTATRRLAAILAADVAGYSRLIGADEEGTLNRLRSIRADLIDPKITEHRGRIVKTTGDGLLVEFSSVVDALRCATEWQTGMTERNAATPGDNCIEFRIGVHQGDIVVEDVLPHQRMFPRRRALPHQACSRCLTDPPSEPQLLF
jgi:adenylate cyclase